METQPAAFYCGRGDEVSNAVVGLFPPQALNRGIAAVKEDAVEMLASYGLRTP